MKIFPVGAELLHAESGRTDRYDEANSRFSQFCERALKRVDPLFGQKVVYLHSGICFILCSDIMWIGASFILTCVYVTPNGNF